MSSGATISLLSGPQSLRAAPPSAHSLFPKLLILLLLIAPLPPLRAQEEPEEREAAAQAAPAVEEGEAPVETAEERASRSEASRLEMEIRTSTLSELAEWCRSLGLAESGTAGDMAQRLRGHFGLPSPSAAESKAKVITIEKARDTEYFTVEAVNEDYARLSGGVEVSLQDGGAVYKIKAWEILYNRTRNAISANGNVEFKKTQGDTIESFRGESFTVNLDSWTGVFLDTISERALSGVETAYRFAGQVISQNGSETHVLRDARITNAKTAETFWSIDAARVWLLPGSDFAIFNAFLKVGEIPLMYLPFFFYPADQLVFHPALGKRSREGYFVQTTTYILGKAAAKAEEANSVMKILGAGGDMEQVREGVFLRSTGQKAKSSTDEKLAILLDAYSNLGLYVGTEIALPKKGPLNSFTLSGGLAFSHHDDTAAWNAATFEATGTHIWDKSYILGFEMPFRYRLDTAGTVSGKWGGFKFSLPAYSDPFVSSDFTTNRTEDMNWVEMLKQGSASADTSSVSSGIASYSWDVNVQSFSLPVAKLNPFLSSFSVSKIQSTFNFRQMQIADKEDSPYLSTTHTIPAAALPYRFVPDNWMLYSTSVSLSGAPFSWRSAGTTSAAAKDAAAKDPLEGLGTLVSPWGESEDEEGGAGDPYPLEPPELKQTFTLASGRGLAFSMNYSASGASSSTLTYDYDAWTGNRITDVSLSDKKSLITSATATPTIGFSFSETGSGIFSSSLNFNGTARLRSTGLYTDAKEYAAMTEEKREETLRNTQKNDYEQTDFNSTAAFTTTLKPLYMTTMFKGSSLTYNLTGLVFKNTFDAALWDEDLKAIAAGEEDIEQPRAEWTAEYGGWEKDKITAHSFSARFQADLLDTSQSPSLTTYATYALSNLPPFEDKERAQTVTAGLTAKLWLSTTTAQTGVKTLYEDDDEDWKSNWKRTPLTLTETLKWGGLTFTQNAVYDFDTDETLNYIDEEGKSQPRKEAINDWTSMRSSLSYSGTGKPTVSAAFNMTRDWEYVVGKSGDTVTGWKQDSKDSGGNDTKKSLIPKDFSLSLSQSLKQDALFRNLLSYSASYSTSLSLDLQRYTYSSLTFSLTVNLKITAFLDMGFTYSGTNSAIYRYLQDNLFAANDKGIPHQDGEADIFKDFLNSFRFDDKAKRESSGFKMKSVNISLVHHLGDWDATLSLTSTPEQKAEEKTYKLRTDFSFFVKWSPVSEFKTEVYYKNETFSRSAS